MAQATCVQSHPVLHMSTTEQRFPNTQETRGRLERLPGESQTGNPRIIILFGAPRCLPQSKSLGFYSEVRQILGSRAGRSQGSSGRATGHPPGSRREEVGLTLTEGVHTLPSHLFCQVPSFPSLSVPSLPWVLPPFTITNATCLKSDDEIITSTCKSLH